MGIRSRSGNNFIWLAGLLFSLMSQTGQPEDTIFKCVNAEGEITFQEDPCAHSQIQDTVDPSVTVALDGALPIVRESLIGKWCFYEHQFEGGVPQPERVTLELYSNNEYSWEDPHWDQSGKWQLRENTLIISDFGDYRISLLTSDRMHLQRLSNMKLRRGGC